MVMAFHSSLHCWPVRILLGSMQYRLSTPSVGIRQPPVYSAASRYNRGPAIPLHSLIVSRRKCPEIDISLRLTTSQPSCSSEGRRRCSVIQLCMHMLVLINFRGPRLSGSKEKGTRHS